MTPPPPRASNSLLFYVILGNVITGLIVLALLSR